MLIKKGPRQYWGSVNSKIKKGENLVFSRDGVTSVTLFLFGSMSIVGVETKQEMIDRVGEKSSGTIFMYGKKGFSF